MSCISLSIHSEPFGSILPANIFAISVSPLDLKSKFKSFKFFLKIIVQEETLTGLILDKKISGRFKYELSKSKLFHY